MASTVIGSLYVNLGLNTAQFAQQLDGVRGQLGKIGANLTSVGRTMSLAISTPLLGVGAGIVKVAGDFESSMNRVRAALGASDAEFTALREQAVLLGDTTTFSASEAADAIEILAKNGLDASQILGGALKSSLLLAASSGSDLAAAGDLATDVMLNFGKQAGDLETVVNGVTGTLLESKFGFDDYRLAIAQAGGVAGGLGVPFEEFNAVIAATSSAFASGSDAGTSFKTFLTRLTPTSDAAAAAIEDLGLKFFNADGSMKSMAEVAGILQEAFADLSDEAKTAALKDIFGVDAMRTAIGLMQTGSEGIRELDASIREASASEQAEARMKGFAGAMEQLKGALEGLTLAIADSGLLEWATQATNKIADLVRQVSQTNPELLKWSTIIAGIAVVLGPVLVALGLFVTAIAAIGLPVAAVIAGITALVALLVTFREEIKAAFDEVVASVESAKERIVQAFADTSEQMEQAGRDLMEGLELGIKEGAERVRGTMRGVGEGIVGAAKSILGIQSPSTVFAEIGRDTMLGFQIGLSDGATGATAAMRDASAEIGNQFVGILDPLRDALHTGELSWQSFADSIVGIANRMTDRIIDESLNRLEDALLDALFGSSNGGGGLLGALAGAFGGAAGGSFQSGSFGSLFSGVYAGGGFIPSGRFGLVGEAGPEFVSGPARVVSAADTASMMSGGVVVNVVNNAGADVGVQQRQTQTGQVLDVMIERKVAEQIGRGGSRVSQALDSRGLVRSR